MRVYGWDQLFADLERLHVPWVTDLPATRPLEELPLYWLDVEHALQALAEGGVLPDWLMIRGPIVAGWNRLLTDGEHRITRRAVELAHHE